MPCPGPAPYTGPTESMVRVVAEINANNSKLPTLAAHHFYEADVVDEKKQNHHVSGDGVLLYMTPNSMRLTADNTVVGTVFEIGSNPKSYWLKLGPQTGDTMYWGNWADYDALDPQNAQIPIRPDMVLDVLGITMINPNFNTTPAPTMRFDPYADAYVFVWSGKAPTQWVALREVWYDRTTKLPKLILLYDMNGRVALRAEFADQSKIVNGRPTFDIKNYRQVPLPGLSKDQWPWMPENYHLYFPASGSKLTFTIERAALTEPDQDVVRPERRSFRMPNPAEPGVSKVYQIGQPAGN